MNKKETKMFESEKTYIFNAITFCDFVKEELIFSDRYFLTEQIIVERVLFGSEGFNKISDALFVLLHFFGKFKTFEITMTEKVRRQNGK
jgi:hypothetical protein